MIPSRKTFCISSKVWWLPIRAKRPDDLFELPFSLAEGALVMMIYLIVMMWNLLYCYVACRRGSQGYYSSDHSDQIKQLSVLLQSVCIVRTDFRHFRPRTSVFSSLPLNQHAWQQMEMKLTDAKVQQLLTVLGEGNECAVSLELYPHGFEREWRLGANFSLVLEQQGRSSVGRLSVLIQNSDLTD